jgi:hypothetical protein
VAGIPLRGEMAEFPPCSFLIPSNSSLISLAAGSHPSYPYSCSHVLSQWFQWEHIQSTSWYTSNPPAQQRSINPPAGKPLWQTARGCPPRQHLSRGMDNVTRCCWRTTAAPSLPSLPTSIILSSLMTRGPRAGSQI